jgi:hypothetical protein
MHETGMHELDSERSPAGTASLPVALCRSHFRRSMKTENDIRPISIGNAILFRNLPEPAVLKRHGFSRALSRQMRIWTCSEIPKVE